ncbi:Phospholipase C [Parelaphostrongylus tenuis]|uniref:Phospholipase C n=1 Tax=Parelaphostrongylus tenuis TaxID=148309 RepID=A0AAD5QH28_PARTN|nr:Phospholipase C [Parelaphostrongylus tenuis]
MSVPVSCWKISFGQQLSENEFLYFLAPQQIAQVWTTGLQEVVRSLKKEQKYPDRRMIWIKDLYLQLYKKCAPKVSGCGKFYGPRPYDALQAFGGRVERWKGFESTIISKVAVITSLFFYREEIISIRLSLEIAG